MADQPPHSSASHSQEPVPSSSVPTAPDPDLDEPIDQDIDMNAENQTTNTEDNAGMGGLPSSLDPLAAAPPPSKKETSLREFLGKMDEYAPIVRFFLNSLFPLHSPLLL